MSEGVCVSGGDQRCLPRVRKGRKEVKRRMPQLGLLILLFVLVGAIVNIAFACAWSFICDWKWTNPNNLLLSDVRTSLFGMSCTFVLEKNSLNCGMLHESWGWPMACMGSVTRIDCGSQAPNDATSTGFILSRPHYSPPTLSFPKVVPRTPIWLGLFVNSVCYAAIPTILLLSLEVKPLMRWWRARRGLCPKCAYDLRGGSHQACPECGRAVTR